MNNMVKRVYQSNTCGPFIILNTNGSKVDIQFVNTGAIVTVLKDNAINGRVADPLLNGKRSSNDYNINRFDNYEHHINNLLKMMYKHMMDRCYNNKAKKYDSYGLKGVTVCDRWKNDINNFLQDARKIDGFDKFYAKPYLYELDKDYKQLNIPKCNRVYSLETCIFLYFKDNQNLRIIDNKDSYRDKYYGVEHTKAGNYYARIKINGVRYNIGTFSNPIAAANAYNYWHMYYHDFELIPLLNNVPYMPPNEFIKYNVAVKQLCKICD